MLIPELKEVYDKIKMIDIEIERYEKLKRGIEGEVVREKLKLLDLPVSSSESNLIYEKIHLLWKSFQDALNHIKTLETEKVIYEKQLRYLEDGIEKYLYHDVFQLGNALEKVINSISTEKFVFNKIVCMI